MKRPTATVVRYWQTRDGGWAADLRLADRRILPAVPIDDNHPEGTRLYLVDGSWVRP